MTQEDINDLLTKHPSYEASAQYEEHAQRFAPELLRLRKENASLRAENTRLKEENGRLLDTIFNAPKYVADEFFERARASGCAAKGGAK